MEKKKPVSLAQLNINELEKELSAKVTALNALRKSQMLGKLDNYYKIVRAKKDLARIKTFICQKKG
ncbi:MAG: 50S ribosomal protein L29 [bacterium]